MILLVGKDDAEFKNMAMRLTKDEKLRNTIGSRAKKYIADHLDISITGKNLWRLFDNIPRCTVPNFET